MNRLRGDLHLLRRALSTEAARRAAWRDLRLPPDRASAEERLREAIKWLCRAQDAVPGGGVSYGFDLTSGWLPPYPETTGYLIPTFLRCAREHRASLPEADDTLRERARRMAHWLTAVQLPCGALPGGPVGTPPVPTVFNTGQVLQGWCHAYREFGDEVLAGCLARAARWLVGAQDADGCWRRFLSPLTVQAPATYNVRTAAALLEAAEVLGDPALRTAAAKNLDWALGQQQENGWFAGNCLTDLGRPLTHTIGYTLEGLLDAALILGEERYLSAILRASQPLRAYVREDGFLSGRFDSGWRPQVSWNCLTGACQIALVWARLSKRVDDPEYAKVAKRLLGFVCRTQILPSEGAGEAGLCGGIKGSQPVWGGYDPFRLPNWAAKFFVDALLASGSP